MTRTETDFIGPVEIPEEALFGINAVRARENFPDHTPFHKEWYKAVGIVKQSCYITARHFFSAASKQFDLHTSNIRVIPEAQLHILESVAAKVAQGDWYDQFIVPAVQGGAGTSINMNINEIIANAALVHTGKKPGTYSVIDPVEHANIFQSTNDVIPTALKVAVMHLLNALEEEINRLRHAVELKEQDGRNKLRVGYTQMQEAVPTSFDRLFSTYSDALSRDWWRVSKCFERIKTVNLGGSAIGSGLTVPRYVVMEVVQVLKELTGLPVTRSENMHDATGNLDSFVEIHAILKAHAVNLEKMVNDLRLLASDTHVIKELEIPKQQVGSSIMPAKVNPVIPEFVISASHTVYSNDILISNLCAQGCLELNAYLPVIGHKLLDSLKLLIASCQTLKKNMIEGIRINSDTAYNKLIHSPAIATALLPVLGYHKSAELAKAMTANQQSIFEANASLQLIEAEKLESLMKPENLLKEGFSLKDI
ncbi:lyase family protein [Saccharicrinis sp. FJH54]|uniref:lyase family protein n=1 Tax=Saccharicrinis sp. FJH54 TaxID=3344665 RepID=UPI0035D4142C